MVATTVDVYSLVFQRDARLKICLWSMIVDSSNSVTDDFRMLQAEAIFDSLQRYICQLAEQPMQKSRHDIATVTVFGCD